MPSIRLVPVHEEEDNDDDGTDNGTFSCPLFQTSERSGEDNFILELELPTDEDATHWVLGGVALLCQEPKD